MHDELTCQTDFETLATNAGILYRRLEACELMKLSEARAPIASGIYVFYEGGIPRHVGRSRNLRQRFRGHASTNHFSATFAFKLARESWRAEGGTRMTRAELIGDHTFRAKLADARKQVSEMSVRWLEVPCRLDCYMLELYAAMQLGTSLDEFDTH